MKTRRGLRSAGLLAAVAVGALAMAAETKADLAFQTGSGCGYDASGIMGPGNDQAALYSFGAGWGHGYYYLLGRRMPQGAIITVH